MTTKVNDVSTWRRFFRSDAVRHARRDHAASRLQPIESGDRSAIQGHGLLLGRYRLIAAALADRR